MAGNLSPDYTGETASSLIRDIGTGAVGWVGSSPESTGVGAFLTDPSTGPACPLNGFPTLCKIYQTQVPPGFSGHILDFILFVLYPIGLMLSMTAVVIGIILFIIGIHRLRHHHANQNSKQVSYLGTVAYFISGVILIQYGPILHMISASTFFGMYATENMQYMPTVFDYVSCVANAAQAHGGGDAPLGCTAGQNNADFFIQELTFSLLLIVGLFSFLRGVFLLVKLGEGGPEGGVLSKAIAHIVAGIIGVNAQAAWMLVQDMTSTLTSS